MERGLCLRAIRVIRGFATTSILHPQFSISDGFTLVEMLTVIVLVGILMTAAGLSVRKATDISRRTKAESECRELVNALLEYRATFDKWPKDNPGEEETATAGFLNPLIDSSGNSRGLVFLNLTLSDSAWNDPWGRPYRVHFPASETMTRPKAMEACVSFPFRRPPPIQ